MFPLLLKRLSISSYVCLNFLSLKSPFMSFGHFSIVLLLICGLFTHSWSFFPPQLMHVCYIFSQLCDFFKLHDSLLSSQIYNLKVFKNYCIYLFLALLGCYCYVWAFYSCGEWGLLSNCSVGFSLWWPLLWSTGSRHMDFSIAAQGLISCGPRAIKYIFLLLPFSH